MWHLDTNIVVEYLRGNQSIAEQIAAHLPDIAISSLTLAELLYGAQVSARPNENADKINQLLEIIEVIDFDQTSAEHYSRVRAALKHRGKPAGEMDMLIAAVTFAHEATLVTHNTKHFENIEGLKLEDWIK